ncbi:J domain-containing protein [Tropicimonas sp.]|uniref:J domain-containing protein n=1 Tax=Tropicimonas sp. TaxID=2067044 RepID=UPI003A88A8F5
MAKPDPFGFDISAANDKKKRSRGRRGMSGAFETSQRICEYPGCDQPGKYRAPKSPDTLDQYYWFCKEHVREYNLKWNFFDATTEEEAQAQIDSDRVWGRETKPFRQSSEERAWARLGIDDAHQVLGENATRNPGRSLGGGRRLPPTERRALEILDAREHWTKAEVRKSYKALIKVLHPDMNGGDRSDEDRLQEVVWAWDQIKDSRNFK